MNRNPISYLCEGEISVSHQPVHTLKHALVDENTYASVACLLKFLNSFEEAKKRFPYLILIQIEKSYAVYYSRYALSSGTNLIRS